MPKFMNLKKLTENKEAKMNEMRSLISKADEEERALNEEEVKKFNELQKEVDNINASIEALQSVRSLEDHIEPTQIPETGKKKEEDKKTT